MTTREGDMATLAQRPLPQCTAPAPSAPVCGYCVEGQVEDDDFGLVECGTCEGTNAGTWVEPCEFRLSPSRTHKHRRCQYDPSRQIMRITMGRKFEDYAIAEFEPGDGWTHGRAFVVAKDAGRGEVRNVFIGPAGECRCDCEGETFASAHKANQAAHEVGEELYPTYGCKHLDSLVPLVAAGWFNLNAPAPAAVT